MTVFTTIISPNDCNDNRFLNPNKISPNIDYQLPPFTFLSIYHIQKYLNDILSIPCKIHSNSTLSLIISNNSLKGYKNSKTLNNNFDILLENSKLFRLDLDFTQFKFNSGILTRIFSLINHLQKKFQYNLFLSLTLPINKNYLLDDEFLSLIVRFNNEFININMINLLITKDSKLKTLTWFEIFQKTYLNISLQLKNLDHKDEIFIGNIEKYLGFVFDGDIIPSIENENNPLSLTNSVKNSVRQHVIHGERKNMNELEFLKIWNYLNYWKIKQFKIKCYLNNCSNINKLINKLSSQLNNNEKLLLPKDFLIELANEMKTYDNNNDTDSLSSIEQLNIIEPKTPPPYDKAIEDKIRENEYFLNKLIKLPSYYSTH